MCHFKNKALPSPEILSERLKSGVHLATRAVGGSIQSHETCNGAQRRKRYARPVSDQEIWIPFHVGLYVCLSNAIAMHVPGEKFLVVWVSNHHRCLHLCSSERTTCLRIKSRKQNLQPDHQNLPDLQKDLNRLRPAFCFWKLFLARLW